MKFLSDEGLDLLWVTSRDERCGLTLKAKYNVGARNCSLKVQSLSWPEKWIYTNDAGTGTKNWNPFGWHDDIKSEWNKGKGSCSKASYYPSSLNVGSKSVFELENSTNLTLSKWAHSKKDRWKEKISSKMENQLILILLQYMIWSLYSIWAWRKKELEI